MRLTGSRAFSRPGPTPTMPPGLVELMEGLAKDVLKHNPENVYEFCAGHMQKLLEIRDGPAQPPKKLSLEQKIANAQEKIRQRTKYRHLQHDINKSEQSNENHELEDEPPVARVSMESTSASATEPIVKVSNENTSAIQPVKTNANEIISMIQPLEEIVSENTSVVQLVEKTLEIPAVLQTVIGDTGAIKPLVHEEKFTMDNEVEISHEPDAIITNNETSTDEASQVAQGPKDVVVASRKLDPEYPTGKNIDRVKENVAVDTNQISDIEAHVESRNVTDVDVQSKNDVAQKLDTEKPTEKNIDEVKENVGVDTKQISDIEANVESRNVTDVDVQSKNDVAQKLDTEDSTEKDIEEVKENVSDVTKQISDIEANVESRNVAEVNVQSKNDVTQKLDTEDPVEKNIEEVKENVDVVTKPISDIEVNVESRNVTKVDVKSQNDVEPFIGIAGNIPQIADNHEAQTPSIVKEVACTPLLANNNNTVLLHIDNDTKTTDKNLVEEEKIVKKEELTDTKHEEILIKKYATKIEPEESVNGVFEQHEIIKEGESADIHPEVKKGDQIESNESVDGVTRASEDNKDEQDHTKVHFQSNDATVEELTIHQQEIRHQNETVSDKNLITSPTDTETPEISHPQISNAEITEDQVIASGKTEQANVDDSLKNDGIDDNKSQVNYETEVDKQLSDDNDKLPEQECENRGKLIVKDPKETQDYTTTLNENDTIIEGDETPESTTVTGMDLETAAITIQKVFRTFLFSKSRASTLEDTVNENSLDEDIEKKDESEYILTSSNLNKERRTLGISRMDTVLQTVNEEKSLSLSDDSSLSSAATIIQAHVRGFLVRNRLVSNKTASTSSLVNSDGPSTLSLDGDVNEPKKTVLNIHIVPERGQFMSRDESLLTSIDLPLDNSPPSSINLHPLGYDKSAERRKQLKREDAVQSISPPSNNSGKLSEEIETVKDTLNDSIDVDVKQEQESVSVNSFDKPQDADTESCDTTLTISSTAETVVDADTYNPREVLSSPDHNMEADNKTNEVVSSSDENDVVTPYPTITEKTAKVASVESENDEKPKLVHSGEFHDIVVQTQVKRSESSVVREFKNVLVYFLLWDKI